MTFATWDDQVGGGQARAVFRDAVQTLQLFAQQPTGWVVLLGPPGVGKTHLLAATVMALREARRCPIYVIAPEFLGWLRHGIATHEEERRVEVVREAEVLLMDDLGAEQTTEWADQEFYLLLDHRYRNRLPTVLASNFQREDISARIASRMSDRALARGFELVGEDYRASDAQARKAGWGR